MNNNRDNPEYTILAVEDSPTDARLLQEAVKELALPWKLWIQPDALEAKNFLRKDGMFNRAPRPHLIFLDLNLPKKQGLELLDEIKQDEQLKDIPVIILSASAWDIDILKAYALHANSYLIKPILLEQFIRILKTVHEFWFETAKLPVNI